VRDRLNQEIDIVVVIEVAEKKSSWTRDEMARAQRPDAFLIPIVENGAKFDEGIYGSHEYIPFASHHIETPSLGFSKGCLRAVHAASRM
jgi:hypothetical protein